MKKIIEPYLLLVWDKNIYFITPEKIIEIITNKKANPLEIQKIFLKQNKIFDGIPLPRYSRSLYYEEWWKYYLPNIFSYFLMKRYFYNMEQLYVYYNKKFYLFSEKYFQNDLNLFISLINKEQKIIFDKVELSCFDIYLYFPENIDNIPVNNIINTSEDLESFFKRVDDKKIFKQHSSLVEIEENSIIFSPIIRNKNINISCWFGYWSIYWSLYEEYNWERVAFWFDFFDKDLAKIRANSEAIERFNSSWFKWYDTFEDINYSKESNYAKLLSSFLWFDVFLPNNFIPSKKVFKVWIKESFFWFEDSFSYVPCELIYYPHNFPIFIWYTNSNGVAAWRSIHEAIENAFFEMSERDSIVYIWLKKISPPKIHRSILSQKLQNYLGFLEKEYSSKITILDISLDKKFPHILVITENQEWYYEFWASSGKNWEDTIWKALRESTISTIWYNWKHKFFQKKEEREIIQVTDHKHYYNTWTNRFLLSFLFEWDVTYKLKNFNINISDLIKESWDVYWINLSTEYSLKKFWIYVVRLFSVKFLPIWFWYRSKHQILYNKDKLSWHQRQVRDFLHFFP